MGVPFGLYRSSGGLNRSLFFQRAKGEALALALPEILARLRAATPTSARDAPAVGRSPSPFGRFSDALTPGRPVPSQPSPFFAEARPSPFFAQPPEVEERRERFAVPFEERETGGGAFGPLGDIAGAVAGVPGDVANRLLRFRGLRGLVEGEPFISEQEAAREGLQVDLSPARLIEPTLTPEQAARLESLPIVGPAVRREAEFLSTPLGLAGSLAFPAATAAGTVGGIAAGTAAEQAGAGETGQLAAQIAGNVLAPGAGLVPRGVVTRPAGALARAGRETVEEAAARARLAPEAGGGRLGAEPPDLPPERLPGLRDVEARSARIPPEVQAELRGPPPEVHAPLEDFETVEARWGQRFRQNWWTRAEDVIGGIVPAFKRAPVERAVRNTMVTRDLYIGTQGRTMRVGLMGWLGSGGRELGLDAKGIAHKVQIAEGADIPKGLAGRIDHIVEHPEKYILDAPQQAAVQEARDITEQVFQMELRAGIDIQALRDAYWPRIFSKLPTKRTAAGTGPSFPRVTPGHAKQRVFTDIEDAWRWAKANDAKLTDPITALDARLQSGVEAIANRRSLDRIKQLGYKSSDRIDPAIAEEARAAREQFKATRKAAVKKGATVEARVAFASAEGRLEAAKRALRIEGRKVAERQPVIFGRHVTQDIADQVGRYTNRLPDGTFDDVLRVARANMINADEGSLLIQNWNTLWRNPVGWVKGAAYGNAAIAREPYGYMARNLDVIAEGARYGAIPVPSEFLLSEGGKLSQRVGKAPIIKQSQRFFEWNVLISQTERWKAVRAAAKTPDELLDMAAVMRKQAGMILAPGLTQRQAKWLSRTWFAPQFLVGITSSLADPILARGPARVEALRTLGSAIGGAIGLTVLLNYKLNGELPNLALPNEKSWMGVRVGDGYVYPLGPYHPILKALSQSATGAAMVVQGKKVDPRTLLAWPRFAEGRLNIGPRLTIRAAEALGIPISAIRGRPFEEPELNSIEDWQRFVLDYAPIGPSQAIEGIRKGFEAGVAEIAGGRTTPFSGFDKLKQRFEEKNGRPFNPETDFPIAEQDPDLLPFVEQMRREGLARGTEGAVRAEQIDQTRLEIEENLRLPETAQQFLAGDLNVGDNLMRDWRDAGQQMVGAFTLAYLNEDPKRRETPAGQALQAIRDLDPRSDEFFDEETREVDWEAFGREESRLKAELRRIDRALADSLEKQVSAASPQLREAEPQLRQARELRDQYFEIPRYLDPSKNQEELLAYEQRLDEFMRHVRIELARAQREFGPDFELTRPEAAIILGKRDFNDQQLGEDAALIFRNKVKRNPEQTAFLKQHQAILAVFFPELYRRKDLQAELSDELFEVVIGR